MRCFWFPPFAARLAAERRCLHFPGLRALAVVVVVFDSISGQDVHVAQRLPESPFLSTRSNVRKWSLNPSTLEQALAALTQRTTELEKPALASETGALRGFRFLKLFEVKGL